MDLLQTVRKEGSRGGVNFSWDDVKSSAHRENYLGHSLKAPVGRWQRNRDLGWYAKGDDADETAEQRAEREKEAKREELRRVKEAEEEAMARALGLPVPERKGEENANLVPLGLEKGNLERVVKEAVDGGADEDGQGLGFGGRKSGEARHDDHVRKSSETREERHRRHERRRDRDRRPRRRDAEQDEYRRAERRRNSRSKDRDYKREHERDQASKRAHSAERSKHRSRSVSRRRDDSGTRRRKEYVERSGDRHDDERRKRRRSRSQSQRRNRSRSRSPYR